MKEDRQLTATTIEFGGNGVTYIILVVLVHYRMHYMFNYLIYFVLV